jgi:hypothetical protein
VTLEAARRVYERKAAYPIDDKPPVYGPWHVRNDATGFTLCGQGLHGSRPYERAPANVPPTSGKLCTRCWDRNDGKRSPDTTLRGMFVPPDLTPRGTA